MTLDRHPIIVIEPTEIAEHLVTGERCRFARHTFHHVAIAAYDINVVIEHREFRSIELLSQPAPGKSHAYTIAAALAERASRCLNSRCQIVFSMARAFAVDLPKPFDIVERDRVLSQTLVFGIELFHT